MDSNKSISLSLFGYNRAQADHIIQEQSQMIKELEDKVTQLEAKVENVQEDLEAFQTMEEALTKGIVDARLKGDEIIEESNQRADLLVNQTQEQVLQYKEEFAYFSRELAQTGTSLKDELNAMKSKMQAVLEHYQVLLDETNFDSLYPAKQVDRLINQVDAYEQDDLFDRPKQGKQEHQESTLTDDEKKELQALIQDVIHQEDEENENHHKLVNFKSVNQ